MFEWGPTFTWNIITMVLHAGFSLDSRLGVGKSLGMSDQQGIILHKLKVNGVGLTYNWLGLRH